MSGNKNILDQGLTLIENMKKKAMAILNPVSEGYYGILSTDFDASLNKLSESDRLLMDANESKFEMYKANLLTAKQALNTKKDEYLTRVSAIPGKKNYNLFINRPLANEEMNINSSGQCVPINRLNNLPINVEFSNNYPVNFTSFNEAKHACQMWSFDSGKNIFALSKKPGGVGYNCHTSNSNVVDSSYIVQKVGYVLADMSANSTSVGQLFYNGKIGIYDSDINQLFGLSYPNTIDYTLTDKLTCDKWNGGGLNKESLKASYGRNCNNVSVNPAMVRYITISANVNNEPVQISQLAVYAFANGKSVNIANVLINPTRTVSATSNPNDAVKAVDGVFSKKTANNIYISSSGAGNYWSLDLKKEYPVYNVIYYNRSDGFAERAIGMKLDLKNANSELVQRIILKSDFQQNYSITKNTDSTPATGTAATTGPTYTYSVIPETSREYSGSYRNLLNESKSELNSLTAWVAAESVVSKQQPVLTNNKMSKPPTAQYMQINLPALMDISGIIVQSRRDFLQYIREFYIQYSLSDTGETDWTIPPVNEQANSVQYFSVNPDNWGSNRDLQKQILFKDFLQNMNGVPISTLRARRIRIIPTDWYSYMSMRAALIKVDTQNSII